MARGKGARHGASDYYDAHLSGFSRHVSNPVEAKKGMIQRMLVRQIGELATNRFKWYNLPKTIDPRFLEMALTRHALAVFYYDFELGRFLALRGGMANHGDVQDNPTLFRVFGNQFTPKTLSTDYCVPIWSNYYRVPDWDIVTVYAARIAEIDTTLGINEKQARRTKIVTVDENRRLSYENIVRQIDEGQPAIKVTEDIFQGNAIQALDLGVESKDILDLHVYRRRVWDEMCGALGIDNSNSDKKERLVAAEVDANEDQVTMTRYVNLNARQYACAQINEMFGLDISVGYRSDAEDQTGTGTKDNLPLPGMQPYEMTQVPPKEIEA